MVKVVGVRFRNAGKIYYFGPGKLDIHAGMHVIVETARGVEMGTVMTEPKGVSLFNKTIYKNYKEYFEKHIIHLVD